MDQVALPQIRGLSKLIGFVDFLVQRDFEKELFNIVIPEYDGLIARIKVLNQDISLLNSQFQNAGLNNREGKKFSKRRASIRERKEQIMYKELELYQRFFQTLRDNSISPLVYTLEVEQFRKMHEEISQYLVEEAGHKKIPYTVFCWSSQERSEQNKDKVNQR